MIDLAPAAGLTEPSPTRTCFVIGPIGDPHAETGSEARTAFEDSVELYESVIVPACRCAGLDVARADQIASPGDITEQVFRHLLTADMVIADIGGGNANVMYELALRHVTGKPTIQLGEEGKLPFNISAIRTIRFVRTRGGLIGARKDLERALKTSLCEEFIPLAPARILRGLDVPKVGLADRPEQEDLPGILDGMLEIEQEVAQMEQDLGSLVTLMETIGELTVPFGDEMARLSQSGAPPSARLAALNRYASSIDDPSIELERNAENLLTRMNAIDRLVQWTFNYARTLTPEQRESGYRDFFDQLTDLPQHTNGVRQGIAEVGVMATAMGGLSRCIRGPARRIGVAAQRVDSLLGKLDEWKTGAESLC